MFPSSSLIISTYNWPAALELCLKSILIQKVLPNEVIVADDGSGEATRQIIEIFKASSPIPVKHVWQEDKGFRLAEIRNKALMAADFDYIIQIDGDIIMHPYFIKDHLAFAKKNTFVRASRVYLNEEISKQKLEQKSVGVNIFKNSIQNKTSAIRIPLLWKLFETNYKNKGDERYEIHGCNMAFWLQDAMEVNGYNEDFLGWGPEDKEFVARLLNSGKEKRFLKLGGIAFHLYHIENPKPLLKENERLLKNAIAFHYSHCENGLNKYFSR
jgi:glycosyltransferase involved in cell wall biosynthesis